MSKNQRKDLIIRIESIIGNSCYNKNIQNWGPNGSYYGEGREFKYPITFLNNNMEKIKHRSYYINSSIEYNMLRTGYYAFGANKLNIIHAIERVINIFELEYNCFKSKEVKKENNNVTRYILGDIKRADYNIIDSCTNILLETETSQCFNIEINNKATFLANKTCIFDTKNNEIWPIKDSGYIFSARLVG